MSQTSVENVVTATTGQVHPPRARAIAFYLPQFHPIPENDQWWGAGFTEWTNVAKAKPRFLGHWQPRLPADLGFYDLRVPETRQAQADLARANGIEAFCYWHYWFGHGRRILERPFREVVESGEPDFPFCLAWANQSWTGIWHGQPRTVLIEQTYPGPEDERAHFLSILPALRDRRYLRVDAKPMFVVFAPSELPDATRFIAHWRALAAEHGLPGLFLVAITNKLHEPAFAEFDALTPLVPQDYVYSRPRDFLTKLRRRVRDRHVTDRVNRALGSRLRLPTRYDYADMVRTALDQLPDEPRFLPCVLPNWDNTPRSAARGVVFENATPELFRENLTKAVARVANRPPEHRIVFLKAWNEWAEGNYIEPDHRYQRGWLDAARAALLPGGSSG